MHWPLERYCAVSVVDMSFHMEGHEPCRGKRESSALVMDRLPLDAAVDTSDNEKARTILAEARSMVKGIKVNIMYIYAV